MAAEVGKLPLLNKLLYATDMVGSQAMAQTRNLWLLFFLAPPDSENLPAKVPALDWGPIELDPRVFIAGVLVVGRFIEALDDPIIGWWSDRTRSRWGRRLPFILLGTPFWAVLFSLLWLTPSGDPSFTNAIYMFVVLELFFLGSTLTGGPYEALLPELARSHKDRMSVVAWQFYLGVAGAVLGLVVTGLMKDAFGFVAMGMVIAVCGLVFRYIGLGGIWKLAPRETPPATISVWSSFKATLSNRQFIYFLPTFVFFQLAVTMVIAWLPFFVEEVLEERNGGAVTSLLTAVALVAMTLSVYVLWKLTNRRGKRWVYSACLLGTAVIMPLTAFAGFVPGIPGLAQGVFIAFLIGLPMAGVNLLPRAITADITDYDELRTGMRREGVFYASQNLFEKIGSSFAPLALALLLLLGDTADNPLGLRLVGPVAGIIAFMGFWLFRAYRLPSTVTRESVKAAGLEV